MLFIQNSCFLREGHDCQLQRWWVAPGIIDNTRERGVREPHGLKSKWSRRPGVLRPIKQQLNRVVVRVGFLQMKNGCFRVKVIPIGINKNSIYLFLDKLSQRPVVRLGESRSHKTNINHIAHVQTILELESSAYTNCISSKFIPIHKYLIKVACDDPRQGMETCHSF